MREAGRIYRAHSSLHVVAPLERAAFEADRLRKGTVKLDYLPASCRAVQAVDVLGDERRDAPDVFELRDGTMCPSRLSTTEPLPSDHGARPIPLP